MTKKLLSKPALLVLILYQMIWCAKSLAEEFLFTVHGPNTVGAELAPALAARFLDGLGAEGVLTLPSDGVNESRITGYLPLEERTVSIYVAAHGSSTGFKRLHQKKAGIAAASRRAKPEERMLLQEQGNLYSDQSEYVIGIDGLAIIVHPDNPVSSLEVRQIGQLFSGEITNWQQLGGPDLKVTPFARDDHSGTWDTFKRLVLANMNVSTEEYLQMIDSFDRLSVNFRFEQGKARLDNKARRDIERLADYLNDNPVNIKLIGFGETNDDSVFSQTLARLRADVVKRQLIRAGVPRKSIVIEGFVPKVDRELEVSKLRQIRDRRVEVWVKQRVQVEMVTGQPEGSPAANQFRL